MKNHDYSRLVTILATLLVTLGLACFVILQAQPKSFTPPGAVLSKKKVSFLVTSPVPESYLQEAVGQEAIIYVRSRETARIQIREFSQAPARAKDYPAYGLLSGDVFLFEADKSLYLGLMPAKIGNSATIEASSISVQAILYSIEE
jgi:hypothetical protein